MKEFIDKLIERLEEQKGTESDYSSIEGKKLVRHWNNCVDVCKEIVNQLAEEYINCSTDISTDCSTKVSEMPTGWIPCSERLPEDLSIVLVTDEDGFLQVCKFYEEDKEFRLTWDMWRLNVLAWQPLPAPYTEGE